MIDVFHGNISQEIARGIRVLRNRIEAGQIPPSQLDETLNLATWNIREFGRRHNRRLRSEAAIHYIAEVLYQFDLIAITEVRDDVTDLNRVMQVLGPHWRVVLSDYNTDRAGNRERMAYLYDQRMVTFTGLAAEADPPRKFNRSTRRYEAAIEWWRSPYMASFSAGNFDFILLAAHIRWGGSTNDRIPPLRELAKWVDKRAKDKHVVDNDIIVMGDFNIPKIDDPLYQAITSKGLSIADVLRGTDHGSNLAGNKHYDQILHYKRRTNTFTGRGGVLDFYTDPSNGDWRGLFPENEYAEMTKTRFTYEMSDHLPLWIQLDTWTDDEVLDQILHRP